MFSPTVSLVALLWALLPIDATQPATTSTAAYPDPPQVLFRDLFVAVQTEAIYQDGKAFADAVPDAAPEVILAQYRASHPESPQALKRFVEAHFALPAEVIPPPSAPERVPIIEHIDRLWDSLTRRTTSAPPYSSLLPLPRPYVVPGGRFREIYYWDSYFTMLGLVESNRRDLAESMVDDFAYLIDTYGHVPNGARTYYLSRSQPPFFFEMVGLLASNDPPAAFVRYLPQLKVEYAFWMQGAERLRAGPHAAMSWRSPTVRFSTAIGTSAIRRAMSRIATTSISPMPVDALPRRCSGKYAPRRKADGISARAGSPMPTHARPSIRLKSCRSI